MSLTCISLIYTLRYSSYLAVAPELLGAIGNGGLLDRGLTLIETKQLLADLQQEIVAA